MRTGSLPSADTAFGRISEATTERKPRRRTKAPTRAEVIAVRGDDDWFALFADETARAPRTAMLTRPEMPRLEPSRREAIEPQPSYGEATRHVAQTATAPIQPPELAWIGPDAPAWIRYALVRWYFGLLPVIAGAAAILLGAGVLVFAARSLGSPIELATSDIKLASESGESSRTTTPVAAVTTPAAGGSVPGTPSLNSESPLILSVLERYRRAYGSLDANAVAGVWPSVNTRSLARAFGQLESQRFEFTGCKVDVSGAHAQAICTGRASFVPKAGGRTTRSEARAWAFGLERLIDGWTINSAESR